VPMGDGIRRNVATISQEERNRLRDAFARLNREFYSGDREEIPTGGVSYWFKQDEIHQSTHVHAFPPWRGIAFLTWHRELCNRLEALLREVDPELSLHYWDWTTDPNPDGADGTVNLFSPEFMGAAAGSAGEPWLSAGFYNPTAVLDRDSTGNSFDPPRSLTRSVGAGVPVLRWSDAEITAAETFPEMRRRLEEAHNDAHGYIGGTIANPPTYFLPRSFRLPAAL
jgi:tyrosinase-like protein